MHTKIAIDTNVWCLNDTPYDSGAIVTMLFCRWYTFRLIVDKMMAKYYLLSFERNKQNEMSTMNNCCWNVEILTLYLLPHNFVESLMASSISRKRNLNSTKCRTTHFRSLVHSSVLSTNSLHRSIAFVNASMDASWSSINCHCSFIKLLGMACDFSELVSSPDNDVDVIEWFSMPCAVSSMFGDDGIAIDDDGLLTKLPNAFGMWAKLSRIECIFHSHTHMKIIRNFLFFTYFVFVVIHFCFNVSHWNMTESKFLSFIWDFSIIFGCAIQHDTLHCYLSIWCHLLC